MNSLDNVAPRALREESAKYNGWTNYATWRVNLEIFDNDSWLDQFDDNISAYDLSLRFKEYAVELVSGNDLATDYALAFMSDVNWYEIADHWIAAYKDQKETTE